MNKTKITVDQMISRISINMSDISTSLLRLVELNEKQIEIFNRLNDIHEKTLSWSIQRSEKTDMEKAGFLKGMTGELFENIPELKKAMPKIKDYMEKGLIKKAKPEKRGKRNA